MDKVRLFLEIVVGKEQVENYIKQDHWVEFPTRLLEEILTRYESKRPCSLAHCLGMECARCEKNRKRQRWTN